MSVQKLNDLGIISNSDYSVPRFNSNFKDIKIVSNNIVNQVGTIGVLNLNDLKMVCQVNGISKKKIYFALYSAKVTILVLDNLHALHITEVDGTYVYRFTNDSNRTWVMLQNFFYMDDPQSDANIKRRTTSKDGRFNIEGILQAFNRSCVVPCLESVK